jgi:predicted nuclease with TOPRIM domain
MRLRRVIAAHPIRRKIRVTADRGRVDGEAAEDAVRKIQRLKRAFGRSKMLLTDAEPGSAELSKRATELVADVSRWEDQLEEIRCDMAELLAERDRWRIAHDKLRERLDRHTMEPRSETRSEANRPAQSGRQPAPIRPRSADESQDFTAIDRELERLNASMLRAFNSE